MKIEVSAGITKNQVDAWLKDQGVQETKVDERWARILKSLGFSLFEIRTDDGSVFLTTSVTQPFQKKFKDIALSSTSWDKNEAKLFIKFVIDQISKKNDQKELKTGAHYKKAEVEAFEKLVQKIAPSLKIHDLSKDVFTKFELFAQLDLSQCSRDTHKQINDLRKSLMNEHESLVFFQENPHWLKYADKELQESEEWVLKVVKCNGLALKHTNKNMKDNPKIVLEAIKNNPSAFQYASPRVQKYRAITLLANRRELKNVPYNDETVDFKKIQKNLGKETFAREVADLIRTVSAGFDSDYSLYKFLNKLKKDFPALEALYDQTQFGAGQIFKIDGLTLIVQNSKDHLKNNCTVCTSPEDFADKVQSQKKFPHAFLIQCKIKDVTYNHFTPIYVTQEPNGSLNLLGSDSIHSQKFIIPILDALEDRKITFQYISPNILPLEQGNVRRQTDGFSCAHFALYDVNFWLKNPEIAKRVIQKVKAAAETKLQNTIIKIKEEKSAFNKCKTISLPSFEFYPVPMMKITQDCRKIDSYKEFQLEKAKNKPEEIEALKNEFKILDTQLDKHARTIGTEKKNWAIRDLSYKNIAKLVEHTLLT